jgi:alpha-galactosidase
MEMNQKLRAFAGPGKWNDPDMLEVGNGMPANEARAHFSLWCMMASPLIAGNDLRAMDAETISILTNKDMIAVDQDSLGIQGFRYEVKDSVETWLKPLKNNAWAIMYFNRGYTPKPIEIDWKNVQITDTLTGKVLNTTKKNTHLLRDLWLNKEIGNTKKTFRKTIPARDVVCLKVYQE